MSLPLQVLEVTPQGQPCLTSADALLIIMQHCDVAALMQALALENCKEHTGIRHETVKRRCQLT